MPGRIALITSGGLLGTVAADGGTPRLLTAPGRYYQFPAWSPDGAALAVIGSAPDHGGVFVLRDEAHASEGAETLHTSAAHRPFYLYWSPDGRYLGFLATHPTDDMGLHLAPRGGPARLLATGRPCFWQWAPTSDQMLVHRGFGAAGTLAVLRVDGMSAALESAPGLFQTPGISPSGQYHAYARLDDDGVSSLVIARTGGPPLLAMPHHGAVALGWSPVRDQLAAICPTRPARSWYGPLRLYYPGSRTPRTLVEEDVLAFFWAPDGRTIACLTLAGPPRRSPGRLPANGFYANGRTPAAARAGGAADDVALLDMSLVTVANGRRRHLAGFAPTELFLTQLLPFFDQYALSHRLWAPDASALAVPAVVEGLPLIVVMPADGGEPAPVAEGVAAFWGPVP